MIHSLSNRDLYPSLRDYVYLNQASLGLISTNVVKEMHDFLQKIAQHGNIFMSDQAELDLLTSMRLGASKLFSCQPSQIAVLASASEMLNQIPYILRPEKNTTILMVDSDFPGVTRPWIKYCKENSCTVSFVKENPECDLTENILNEITSETSIIQVSLIQFSSGSKIDIKKLSLLTRKLGIKLIVDITQAAGALPIKANDWEADVLITSGYKWLGGHGGIGLAYLSEEFLRREPFSVGWMGAPKPFEMSPTTCFFETDARSYTQSTMSYISMVGLQASLKEITQLNPSKIEEHTNLLGDLFLNLMEKTKWIPWSKRGKSYYARHIISLESDMDSLDRALNKLRIQNIICSSRNGRIRFSLAHYNNENDIKRVVQALT